MLTTAEATRAIADSLESFASENVAFDLAAGRILRQVVRAERDQPPFDRVTMDGIAVSFAALDEGNRRFKIQATHFAGDPARTLEEDANCIEVMTGSVLPANTDCVIPVERISIENEFAVVDSAYLTRLNQYVHPQGSDHTKDHAVLQPGSVITPMDIAIFASCGLSTVEVSQRPTIRITSTGNELVPPGQAIEPHQIRMSNGPALVTMLSEQGFGDIAHEHLPDDPKTLEVQLAAQLDVANVLVLSGGVSMGKADFVPQVLQNLGVRLVFHKIRQRPGKPMWFGIGPDNQAVFALPGNPVSALVCCRQYVVPAMRQASGIRTLLEQRAVLAENIDFKADLTCFLPVRVHYLDDGRSSAVPVATNTSGDFAALGGTDGYVELDREQSHFPAGTVVPLHSWNVC